MECAFVWLTVASLFTTGMPAVERTWKQSYRCTMPITLGRHLSCVAIALCVTPWQRRGTHIAAAIGITIACPHLLRPPYS